MSLEIDVSQQQIEIHFLPVVSKTNKKVDTQTGCFFIGCKVYSNHNLTCHPHAYLSFSTRVEGILTIIRSSVYQRKQTSVTRVNYLK